MQKNCHGLERGIFQAGENLLKLKLQITLFVPLVTINQRNLIHADQHDKARRFRGTKEIFVTKSSFGISPKIPL